MIAHLKPYPVMKKSGVEWLGEVPTHWELPRLGSLLKERGEVNNSGHIEEVLSVLRDRGVVPYSEKGNIGNKKSEDITRYKVVRPDDIVVNCMNVIIGSVGLSRYTGCLSPVYYVLKRRSEEDNPQYLNAYFQTKPFQESLVRIGNGILAHRMRIPMELLKCELFPRPPLPEQTAIVRFLDYADRRIRRYISAKQKLIALLKEQKQAIIHQAVTGQIDVRTGKPYRAYKPSGIEWLGDVPAHWEIVPLKRAFVSMEYGISDTGTEDGTISVLTMGDIKEGMVTVPEYGGVTKVAPNLLLQDKDLLFNRTNSAELVAKVGLFRSGKRTVTFASYLVRMRTRQENKPEFLNLLLNDVGFVAAARREAIPSLHQSNLNPTRYGRLQIILPPALEQKAIVEAVDEDRVDIDAAMARANSQIYLLREYCTRLIADVVTGKLDVREAEHFLPEVDPLAADDELDQPIDEDAEADSNELDAMPEEVEA